MPCSPFFNPKTRALIPARLPALILCLIFIFGSALPAGSKPLSSGILLADDQGKILYEKNRDIPLVPASILKLLTSLAALEILGPGHRIKTLYQYDPASQSLYIKGKGDPLFLSEAIEAMCKEIIDQTRCSRISRIVLDISFFAPQITIPGTGSSLNPYDATTGALCANFNTIAFKWDKRTGRYISAEPQTPLLPAFIPHIKASGQRRGRIMLSKKEQHLYPGNLIRYFLEQNGIEVKGPVELGTFPENKGETFEFLSPFTLAQTVEKLLRYSNNFMANQLLLILGAKQYGGPATLDKGLRVIREFAEERLALESFVLAEGSGISRQNRISPAQMLTLVKAFKPYYQLLRHGDQEFYKTGTLSDVRTRAGFIEGKNKRLYPFVIMLNHTHKGYGQIQRKLIQLVNSNLPAP